jgi:hypothetical protein
MEAHFKVLENSTVKMLPENQLPETLIVKILLMKSNIFVTENLTEDLE